MLGACVVVARVVEYVVGLLMCGGVRCLVLVFHEFVVLGRSAWRSVW